MLACQVGAGKSRPEWEGIGDIQCPTPFPQEAYGDVACESSSTSSLCCVTQSKVLGVSEGLGFSAVRWKVEVLAQDLPRVSTQYPLVMISIRGWSFQTSSSL